MTGFIARVGTFFILMGLGFGILFVASDSAASAGVAQIQYNYLCIGTILLSLGFVLRARGAPPPEPSGRFRFLRNMNEGRKKAREEKEKAKQIIK